MKTVEFACFMWILCGLFNFSCVYSSESEAADADADDLGPVLVAINKCDPDSLNSEEEVEQFTKAFGHMEFEGLKVHVLNFKFNFNSSLNSLKNRCKIQTVEIPLSSTLKSTSESENQNINALPEFFDHGFFNYTPTFLINPENYCVKKMSRDILTVEICESASNSTSNSNSNPSQDSNGFNFPPTLQKCCNMGFLLTIDKNQTADCTESYDPPWKPRNFMGDTEIYPNYNFSVLPCKKSVHYILPHQLTPKIKRKQNSTIIYKDVRVLEDGRVETRETGNHQWKKLEENTYCIDGFDFELTGENFTEEIPTDSFMVLECPGPEPSKIKDIIYAATSFISSFVLLIIVVVYGLIWDKQNIHGWTSGAFSLAMLLWLFCTGVRILYTKLDGFCVFIAVATQFCRISVYSWMLLLNFDLWATISSMTPHSQRSQGRTRFFWYCCIALVIPTTVVSISLIIETQFSLFDDSVIRPQYGRERCYLDHTAVKAYAIYPSLILFLSNFLFILLIIKIVLDIKEGRKRLNREDSHKTEMKRCLKLFVIMGVSWIFDIISGLLDTVEVSWYWMITDIYNIAQSFLLFWLFICQKTIRDQLSKKYSIFKVGFKWMDVYFPRCSSATRTSSGFSGSNFGSGRSESYLVRSATFRSSTETSTQSFKSTSDNFG